MIPLDPNSISYIHLPWKEKNQKLYKNKHLISKSALKEGDMGSTEHTTPEKNQQTLHHHKKSQQDLSVYLWHNFYTSTTYFPQRKHISKFVVACVKMAYAYNNKGQKEPWNGFSIIY